MFRFWVRGRRGGAPDFSEFILYIYIVVVFVVVIVVLILTRIIKSVVTGQPPVTLEWRNVPGQNNTKQKVVHAYITADAIHTSARKY